ncbi:MAG: hypothetical protein DSY42_01065 [Aquifex sp.]|nr:MAG: hypothetical protein DSY42_01065 [Aquifex sp.]
MPSISDFINKDDEDSKAKENSQLNLEAGSQPEENQTLSRSIINKNSENTSNNAIDVQYEIAYQYNVNDIKRYVFWIKKYDVMISISAGNEDEAIKRFHEIIKNLLFKSK